MSFSEIYVRKAGNQLLNRHFLLQKSNFSQFLARLQENISVSPTFKSCYVTLHDAIDLLRTANERGQNSLSTDVKSDAIGLNQTPSLLQSNQILFSKIGGDATASNPGPHALHTYTVQNQGAARNNPIVPLTANSYRENRKESCVCSSIYFSCTGRFLEKRFPYAKYLIFYITEVSFNLFSAF